MKRTGGRQGRTQGEWNAIEAKRSEKEHLETKKNKVALMLSSQVLAVCLSVCLGLLCLFGIIFFFFLLRLLLTAHKDAFRGFTMAAVEKFAWP